jgi:hypothetical protein
MCASGVGDGVTDRHGAVGREANEPYVDPDLEKEIDQCARTVD